MSKLLKPHFRFFCLRFEFQIFYNPNSIDLTDFEKQYARLFLVCEAAGNGRD